MGIARNPFSVADITLLQLTDLHLQERPGIQMKGVDPEQRFQLVLQAIEEEEADLLLLTGDLSHHVPAVYPRLDNYICELSYPSAWIPGNHDLPDLMQQYPRYAAKLRRFPGWQLIMLDSTAEPDGRGGGSLSTNELEFLQQQLAESDPDQHQLIVMHHHPCPVGSEWQDQIGLGNAAAFWALIGQFSNVRGVIFGHVHQAWQLSCQGVPLFSVPATAAQFKAGCRNAEIESDPFLAAPAYGRYTLRQDGRISQEIVRMTE